MEGLWAGSLGLVSLGPGGLGLCSGRSMYNGVYVELASLLRQTPFPYRHPGQVKSDSMYSPHGDITITINGALVTITPHLRMFYYPCGPRLGIAKLVSEKWAPQELSSLSCRPLSELLLFLPHHPLLRGERLCTP